jgi:hypothetical protein
MSAKRTAVSKRVRFEVFKRDAFTCQYCGAHPPKVLLHCDHIIAVANGGGNEEDNLVTACEPCNLGKSAVPLSAVPESLAARAARVQEAEEQLAGYSAVMEAKRQRVEADIWRIVEALTGEKSIKRDRYQSIKMFAERLGVHAVLEAVDATHLRNLYSEASAFRYFCGVCWNKIRDGDQ